VDIVTRGRSHLKQTEKAMIRFARVASSVFAAAFVTCVVLAVTSVCAVAFAQNCGGTYCNRASYCQSCCNVSQGDCWEYDECDCSCTVIGFVPWICPNGMICDCTPNP
jgi:hypothetical protein